MWKTIYLRGTFLKEYLGRIRVLKAYHLIFENPKVRKYIYNIKKLNRKKFEYRIFLKIIKINLFHNEFISVISALYSLFHTSLS